MANKKVIMSVSAGAIIASAFVGTGEADAASYKVKNGDSLWEIAQKFDTSVSTLKSVNHLTSDIIFPNQVLETGTTANAESGSEKATKKTSTQTSTTKSTTYTVKPGDTLSGIAFKHNISIAELMKWNGLDSTLIYPGNVFVVSAGSVAGSGESTGVSTETKTETVTNKDSSTSKAPNEKVASATVYTVKSGDTLSGIAYRNNVSVTDLRKWNGLKSDLILIGQKLNIGEASIAEDANASDGADTVVNADVDYDVNKLISSAKSLKGIGYSWGGESPDGFDCSGFIYYTYNKAGMSIGRLSSGGYYNRSYYVNKPQVGDLVFFENTYKKGISHLGIYLGANNFIHAGSDGVVISNLGNSYWKKHFEGFKRFY